MSARAGLTATRRPVTAYVRRCRDEGLRRERHRRGVMARWLPAWRTRSRRRGLAALWTVGPLSLIAMTLSLEWGNPVLPWIYVPILCSWFPLWMLLRVLTAATAESSTALLDERERQLRDRLGRTAFQVLIACDFLIVLYLSQDDAGSLTASKASVLLVCSILLASAVPTALLAWRMPDDDPEDFEHPVHHTERTQGEARA